MTIPRTLSGLASAAAGAALVFVAADAFDRRRAPPRFEPSEGARQPAWGAAKPTTAGAPKRADRSWTGVLKRVSANLNHDRILLVAAGVTFYAILALFPAVAALVSIFGLFADPQLIQQQIEALSGFLPGGAVEIIGGQVQRIAAQAGGALGFGFFFGLLVSLWSANAGMKSLFDALNIVYGETERRSFVKLNAVALALTLGAMLFLIAAVGAIVVLPMLSTALGLGGFGATLAALARWPLLLIGVVLALAVLYRFGPCRPEPKWRWLTVGSATAAIVWVIGSSVFSWYVANFGNYNATYGSLGAAIGFLTWIWLTAIVVLAGAELDAELERSSA